MSLPSWYRAAWDCRACGLCNTRLHVVMGDGPVPATYMLIAEAPGEHEDLTGIPLVGAAGKEQAFYTDLAGIPWDSVYKTNIVKCRPTTAEGKNRTPKLSEQKACRQWLEKEIEWVNPKVIILLGASAIGSLLSTISLKEHGIPIVHGTRILVPMYHPAAALHQPSLRGTIEEDWKLLPTRLHMPTVPVVNIVNSLLVWSDAIAVDSETTGLDPTKAELVCVSYASSGNPTEALVQKTFGYETHYPLRVYHNYKYEYKLMKKHLGYKIVKPVADTMIAAYLLGEEQLGLKPLARKHLGWDMGSAKMLLDEAQAKKDSQWLSQVGGTRITPKLIKQFGKPPVATMLDVPSEQLIPYAAGDAVATMLLWQKFEPQLRERGLLRIFEMETELTPMLADMEMRGVLLNVDLLGELRETWKAEAQQIAARYPFNLNSGDQIAKYMEECGTPLLATTESGKVATGRDSLLQYKDTQVVKDLLRYKEISKLVSTYTDSLIERVDSNNRIHPEFNQVRGDSEDWRGATKTGRLSSSNPNFQNLPDRTEEGIKIRRAVVSPPGYSLVSFDYRQIEPLIMAYRAGERKWLDLYRGGGDIYAGPAEELGIKRDEAKTVVLGVNYGAQEYTVAEKSGRTVDEARFFIRRLFESYPAIARYIQETTELARQTGYTSTLWGRRRYESGVVSTSWSVRQAAERELLNHTIQGTAADLMKQAMVDCYKAGLLPIIQVHDELVFEIRDSAIDKVIPNVVQCMVDAMDLGVPIRVSVKVGKNWGEMNDTH